MFMDAHGKTHGEVWEIKPSKETSLQEAGKSPRAQAAAILNMAKWEAARAYCRAQRLDFRIITEHDLWAQGKK
jgi:hypothetical protein